MAPGSGFSVRPIPSRARGRNVEQAQATGTVVDSFARARPQYCFANQTVDVALAPQVAAMRRAEINHALKHIAALTWVDPANIFLIGHSQGAGTVAGYAGPVKIRGRVLINGSCNEMLGGDGMSDDEVLLSLYSGRDPWFARYSTRCREYVLAHPEGRSIYEARSTSHNLMVGHWPTVRRFFEETRIPQTTKNNLKNT